MNKRFKKLNQYITSYNTIIIIIIIAMIVCWFMYWDCTESKKENLLGNSFVGLLTGLIIAILGNIKNRILINKNKTIDLYSNLFQNGNKIYKDIYLFDIYEYIDDIQIWNFYCRLYEFFNECNKINLPTFNKIKENVKITKLIENIHIKIEDMRKKIENENFYGKEQYAKIFKNEIHSYNKSIKMLLIGLQEEKELVNEKKETLQKSIL